MIRFMTVSPFYDASSSDSLQFIKRSPQPERANIRIFSMRRGVAQKKARLGRAPEDLAYGTKPGNETS